MNTCARESLLIVIVLWLVAIGLAILSIVGRERIFLPWKFIDRGRW
jgi:hypothetical protein